LLAYFSCRGENYWNGGRRNLKVGNTEVLAQAISARLDCDMHTSTRGRAGLLDGP
jgi:flavodoxin